MSYEIAVSWSILRSLLAGMVCLWLGRRLLNSIGPTGPAGANRLGRLWRALRPPTVSLFVPFFVPGLVVGYAYRNASLSLVQYPRLNELLYFALQVSQLTPVVVLALRWLPQPRMSTTGGFLWRDVRSRMGWRSRFRGLLTGEFPRSATAFVLATLLCFQEVEVATLMQARGWTEWIFGKQAGTVELADVVAFLIPPVTYSLALLVPVIWYWHRRLGEHRGQSPTANDTLHTEPARAPSGWTYCLFVGVSWLLVIIWPLTSLAIGAVRGRDTIQWQAPIWREVGDALIQAATVTALFGGGLRTLSRLFPKTLFPANSMMSHSPEMRAATRAWGPWILSVLLIPGLLGSLALGLAVFEFCQRIGVSPSYSPWPLMAALLLFFLPRALAMYAMLWRNEGHTNLFLADTLGRSGRPPTVLAGRELRWKLQGAGQFWTMALLFWWSYLELTLPSLLRPAGMAPAPMRLYNFLHYGHIPGLAAMLVVVLGVPLLLGSGMWWAFRKL